MRLTNNIRPGGTEGKTFKQNKLGNFIRIKVTSCNEAKIVI